MDKNLNTCDSGHDTSDEIRVLPFGNGNLLLCRKCFNKEMKFRQEENREKFPSRIFWENDTTLRNIPNINAYSIPLWNQLKIYITE